MLLELLRRAPVACVGHGQSTRMRLEHARRRSGQTSPLDRQLVPRIRKGALTRYVRPETTLCTPMPWRRGKGQPRDSPLHAVAVAVAVAGPEGALSTTSVRWRAPVTAYVLGPAGLPAYGRLGTSTGACACCARAGLPRAHWQSRLWQVHAPDAVVLRRPAPRRSGTTRSSLATTPPPAARPTRCSMTCSWLWIAASTFVRWSRNATNCRSRVAACWPL